MPDVEYPFTFVGNLSCKSITDFNGVSTIPASIASNFSKLVTVLVRSPEGRASPPVEPLPLEPEPELPPVLPLPVPPLVESGVVVPAISPDPFIVAFLLGDTVGFLPASFDTVTELVVLFVTSTDFAVFVVLTELPSAPLARFISVFAPDETSIFTDEFTVVPSAEDATFTGIDFAEDPSNVIFDLPLTFTWSTEPVTFRRTVDAESTVTVLILPSISIRKLLLGLIILISSTPASAGILTRPAAASTIRTLFFALSTNVSAAICFIVMLLKAP